MNWMATKSQPGRENINWRIASIRVASGAFSWLMIDKWEGPSQPSATPFLALNAARKQKAMESKPVSSVSLWFLLQFLSPRREQIFKVSSCSLQHLCKLKIYTIFSTVKMISEIYTMWKLPLKPHLLQKNQSPLKTNLRLTGLYDPTSYLTPPDSYPDRDHFLHDPQPGNVQPRKQSRKDGKILLGGRLTGSCLANILIWPRTTWPGNGAIQWAQFSYIS